MRINESDRMNDDLKNLIEKYSLINAFEHGGESEAGPVIGKIMAEKSELEPKDVMPKVKQKINEINSMSTNEQEELLREEFNDYFEEDESEEDEEYKIPDLPNVEEDKDVIMRLAPFPSGMLHIGNARMAVLNDEYVKRNDGKLYLVIDDTAGSEEKKPIEKAYEEIPKDLEWLNVEFDEIIYKSDRLELFYEYAEEFLNNDWAYVCTCDAERLRMNRREGVECEHRSQSSEENLEKWNKMLEGDYGEREAVVRLKTDMQHDDPAFRDRVLLRISEIDHPKVGNDYRVWPMLEFSWAIDDHKLGMTHILRGKDLVMEDKMEKYMWDLLGWKHPEILHNGLLSIEGIKISTSTSKRKIDKGEYEGWEDPRTWSLKSLKKRGFEPDAIRNFVLSFGLSETSITVPVDTLYNENREIIDDKAERRFFVADPVPVEIVNSEEINTDNLEVELPVHPDYPDRGTRKFVYESGDELYVSKEDLNILKESELVRLMDLFNLKILESSKDVIKAEFDSLEYEKVRNEDCEFIHWINDDYKEGKIIMDDASIKKGFFEDREYKEDQVVQFERFGFCRIDQTDPLVAYFGHR